MRHRSTVRILNEQRKHLSDKNIIFRNFITKLIKKLNEYKGLDKDKISELSKRLNDICSYDVFVIPYEIICILWNKKLNEKEMIYRKTVEANKYYQHVIINDVLKIFLEGTKSKTNKHTNFKKYLQDN